MATSFCLSYAAPVPMLEQDQGMNTFPIVDRELRAASRRRITWWLRVVSVILGLLMALLFINLSRQNPVFQGLFAMRAVAVILAILAGVSGCFLTADCISSERREGTLGLLFLTTLRSRDVILGKLTAAALNMTYGLLAVLPVLLLTILAGGVAAGEVVRYAIVILATLFLSLSLGLLVSTYTHHSTRAAMTTVITMLLITFLPVLVLETLRGILRMPTLYLGFPTFSTFYAMRYVRGNSLSDEIGSFRARSDEPPHARRADRPRRPNAWRGRLRSQSFSKFGAFPDS